MGMKTDLFQSCGHCWVFQMCWHIECSTCTASSFRIWNSSTGIPSPPLALFVVMLSKAPLTSHSKMSGSRWVITSSWLSGSWRSFFVQFFCVFQSIFKCYIHMYFTCILYVYTYNFIVLCVCMPILHKRASTFISQQHKVVLHCPMSISCQPLQTVVLF